MNKVFCTIITRSHLAWALALLDSLRQYDAEQPYCILITDVDRLDDEAVRNLHGVELLFLKDLLHTDLGRRTAEKYADRSDELRWSMKPVLMQHLLVRYEQVIYGDCDLHFHSDPAWMWTELNTSDMLLTPHWRSSRATVDRPNFDHLFVGGLYNAGFVAAARRASNALQLWSENCLEVCIKDFSKGQYVDQTHLNLLPIYFERIQVLKHRGCNVANWNMVECARTRSTTGDLLINGVHPLVFVHYTRSTIDGIVSGDDGLLLGPLTILRDRLLRHGYGKDLIADSKARLARKAEAIAPRTFPERVVRAVGRMIRRT